MTILAWFQNTLKRSLQARLLIVGSLPLLLITTLLTTTNIYIRHNDITTAMNQSGRRMVDHLSRTAEFALYTNNQPLLINMAYSIEQMPNILGIAFLDSSRRMLLSSASFPDAEAINLALPLGIDPQQYEHFLLFEKPVFSTTIEVEDYPDNEAPPVARKTLGWVVVAMDITTAHKQQRDVVFTSIGIATGVLGTAFLLALALSRSVLIPIRKLTATITALQQGNLNARALVSTGDELSVLATGINHLAESVKRSQSNLEKRVHTATLGLTNALEELKLKNAAFQQATMEAEAANQAKGDFLAHMSHELRTPLTAIQGFVRLLGQSPLDPNDKNYCQIIERASSQLLAIINDILEYSKLQSGTQVVINEPYNLLECIEQVVQLLAPGAHHKGLELYCDFAPNTPALLIGDTMAIRQIMMNLIGNAIKFTEQGHVAIHISITQETAHHNNLVIVVSDTGVGMSPNQQDTIFDAFVQADTTIARRFGGTGLGLPIIKAYIELMGGTIHLDSNLGEGTRCRVILPLAQRLPQPSPTETIPGPILLYDTDEQNRKASHHLLARIVNVIIEAATFDAMIDALAEHNPAALLINWSLNEPEHQQMATLEYALNKLSCPVVVQAPLHIIHEQLPADFINDHPTASFITKPASLGELRSTLLQIELTTTKNHRTANLNGIQILVAEDNEFSRLLLCTLLDRTGCQYRQAHNGREAIDACLDTAFDILLIDLHMPEITGIEAIREIRQTNNPNQNTPVIILTADMLMDVQQTISPLEVDYILSKPFDETQLLQALFQLSGRDGAPAPQMLDSAASIPKQHYFAEIDRLLDHLHEAFTTRDIEAMREFCHQLAGIAAVYHLGDLDEQITLLHSLVRAEELNRIEGIIMHIRLETAKLKQANDNSSNSSQVS